jgi:chorismate lyase/3-hydroxybenzoate synthase
VIEGVGVVTGTSTLHAEASYASLALRPQLFPISRLPELLESENLHAACEFSEKTAIDPNDQRRVSIGLGSLSNRKQVEVWWGAGPVSRGSKGRIHYTEDGEFLFGHMLVAEDASVGLAETVRSVYDEVLEFARSSAYPNLYRVWHYLPDINHIDSNLERYRAFCVGRHAALAGAQGFERNLPAASAIGTRAPGLLISFVAGRCMPLQIENPRQVSAFHYPSAYGPRSPLFSRAVWIDSQGCPRLYLSGTASILGHESVHPGDLHEQIGETLRNMEATLANSPASTFKGEVCLRVYMRDANHYRTKRQALEARFGEGCSIVYLRGDICRSELLLEIEGVFGASQ